MEGMSCFPKSFIFLYFSFFFLDSKALQTERKADFLNSFLKEFILLSWWEGHSAVQLSARGLLCRCLWAHMYGRPAEEGRPTHKCLQMYIEGHKLQSPVCQGVDSTFQRQCALWCAGSQNAGVLMPGMVAHCRESGGKNHFCMSLTKPLYLTSSVGQ